ncbi:GNAT family N-acetyltransferase [Polaribacter sp.]|uniref:GNAT family N-acetyltransferase n=1 Tax=Polaribacter sp. TaxID=1920175 RepID=UPI003EF332C5
MSYNFSPFPVLETERLLLREINLDDTKAVFGLRTSKDVNAFITRDIPKNLAQTRGFIDSISNLVAENNGIFWVIQSDLNGELLGTIGLRNFKIEDDYAEIGYEIHPDYQQRGYMNEAFQEVLKFGFQQMKLKTIEAFTHKNNSPSIALLEKHSFVFQPERIDEGFEDNHIYKLVVSD